MSIQFTDAQVKAYSGRGNALLVSAAAGSGKTAVLVERVLRYLVERQGDIRRLVIMTFTEAAAAEMRQKIKKAVDAALQQEENPHLLEQSTLIDSAEIGTIHGICLRLISRYFEKIDLDPRFRLLDEETEAAMVEEEAEAYLEDLNGREEPAILHLLDCYAGGRSDAGLKDLLITGMRFLDEQPLPADYVKRALEPYQRTDQGLFACFHEDGLRRMFRQKLEELLARYDYIIDTARRHPYLQRFHLLESFLVDERTDLGRYLTMLDAMPYDRFAAWIGGHKFPRMEWTHLAEKNPDEESRLKLVRLRDGFKRSFKEFQNLFTSNEEVELKKLQQEGALLETYLTCCMELRSRLAARRRRQGVITYGDMEHLAVELLVEAYDPVTDTLTPTELALELRGDYDELIIDEFQDTNRSQDLIFRALSTNEQNLFMVGDLKQSIYRFRGAEPEIFDQKRRHSVPFSAPELTAPTVLELTANFRSHPSVLRFSNRVFENIMTPELGGVVYDDREKLVPGRSFLQPEASRAELHYLEPEEDPETLLPVDATLQNARYTARLIANAVANREQVLLPDGHARPVEYRDFAILLRTTKNAAGVYERELSALGIPVVNNNKGVRFFDLPEVQSILAYLLVLDNPYNDVALVSLLYGDYFRFTVGELAALRHRKTPLYEDLRDSEDPKAQQAYATIEGYRSLAGTLYVYDLLYRIYHESGIMAAYASGEGGAERCANLELLAEDARLFEQDGYRGLYTFVQHIRISQSGTQGGARLESDENSVRIMSIHKSKGLEFPICILGDCHKTFNRMDLRPSVLLHSRYGAALEDIDLSLYFRCGSLAQEVLADMILGDMVSEQERLFYVALTRAVSKVVLLINMNENKMEKWLSRGAILPGPLPAWMLKSYDASYGSWVTALLGSAAEGADFREKFKLPQGDYHSLCATVITGQEAAERQAEFALPEEKTFDRAAFRTRLDWVYPHLSAVRLPAKLSVSELKGLREQDADAEPLLEERLRLTEPRFASHFKARGSEVGNAMHQALQFCDFRRLARDPEAELDRLVNERFILESQRKLIPVEKLRRFTQSECFQSLLSAQQYSKEERFLFPIPAKELFGDTAEGEILIQGVLDCYSVNGNEAVILDYKTDRVTTEQELIDRYRVQMELYAEALKRVKGLTVVRKEIYSFSLEKTIII